MPSSSPDAATPEKSPTKRTGGVADYFAVLGVGDTLIWKHTQKKQQIIDESGGGGGGGDHSSNENNDAVAKKEEEEEECALVERFYREIVEVKILVNDDDGIDGDNASAGKDKLVRNSNEEGGDKTDALQHDDVENASSDSPTMKMTTDLSQNPSDLSSIASTDEADATSNTKQIITYKGKEVTSSGGYIVVRQTMPAGRSSCASPDDDAFSPATMSAAQEPAENRHGSRGEEEGVADGINYDDMWSKSQTFDADLNPLCGLRGTLLSSVALPLHAYNKDDGDANDVYDGRDDLMKDDSTLTAASSHSMAASATGAAANLAAKAARGISKKVSSRWIGPMLSGSACETGHVGDSMMGSGRDNSVRGELKCAAKYYLAYRRRGADETDVPAIADIALYYVRVHKSTVVRHQGWAMDGVKMEKSTFTSIHAVNDSNAHSTKVTTEDGGNEGDHCAGNSGSNGESAGMAREAKVAGAAALKRGIVTGAGIAARVAVSGASRLMGNSSRGNSISQSTDVTKATGGEDNESGEIDVGGYDDNKFDTVALEKLIDIPDGFDEWSIPETYKMLRLPIAQSASNGVCADQSSSNSMAESAPAKSDCSSPSNAMYTAGSGDNKGPTGDLDEVEKQRVAVEEEEAKELHRSQRRMRKTFLFPHGGGFMGDEAESLNGECSPASSEASGMGVEAYVDGNSFLRPSPSPVGCESSAGDTSAEKLSWIWDKFSPQKLKRGGEGEIHEEHEREDGEVLQWEESDPSVYLPELVDAESLPLANHNGPRHRRRQQRDAPRRIQQTSEYEYVPIVSVRRQRVGEDERFHEDAATVDISLTFLDKRGNPVLPREEDEEDSEDEEEEAGGSLSLLRKSKWCDSSSPIQNSSGSTGEPKIELNKTVVPPIPKWLGMPALLVRRNTPLGFADAPFTTSVIGRFPTKDYKGVPLPEEELPMFCYPTGCRLHRAKLQDAPLANCYGFVVKNERGESIYISCVSFMEPLTNTKLEQLNRVSERRKHVFLPHRRFCERNRKAIKSCNEDGLLEDDSFLTGFDDVVTFENKTICLISRYPHWTAFRRFLSHLHVLSGSSSDLPIERYLSHLLLTVPVPKPGGQCVIVPLKTLSEPMALAMPPAKDLPLVDLPFQRLLACLDIPTIVTIVLGFLALERKVIVMSTHPSLVLDGCELLRSLLFPFELCAPYVPRLTQPFMSCLDFPGAIFVGIHDDGCDDGLAAMVKKNLPEDSAIIDLDTGEIECSGNTYEILKECWNLIPAEPRSHLVSEIDLICRDAALVPGQEPIDSLVDSAFDASTPKALVEDFDGQGHLIEEPLDDRALRDAFLRFFTFILGGYERFLVVPDMDYLISGNEWFDSQKFLAAAPKELSPYLSSFVATQLFQSFIQRRTEASDVHCMLFDECLAEFHSNLSSVPYGRLGANIEKHTTLDGGENQRQYDLLVDQCASDFQYDANELVETDEPTLRTRGDSTASCDESDTETNISHGLEYSVYGGRISTEASFASTIRTENGTAINNSGDIVTIPSRENIPENSRYVYCVDGNPCFPHRFDANLFFPKEPESLSAELAEIPAPILTRSDQELDESARRRKMATSYRGLHNQRRCLWQLPKLMGSHFLGAWLMCVPFQVSQPQLSSEQQAKYLLRALGALRQLRSRQRIVPDEAAYRALIVACGRAGSDRRVEVVKLFGLLRSDGIFPSAVTLGQYTRAIAEGFSKRSSGSPEDGFDNGGTKVTTSANKDSSNPTARDGSVERGYQEIALHRLDRNLVELEESGRRWRQRQNREESKGSKRSDADFEQQDKAGTQSAPTRRNKRHHKSWMPVTCSSSYLPTAQQSSSVKRNGKISSDKTEQPDRLQENSIKFVAIWSRVSSCETCFYVPLDEEIQSGWDVMGSEQGCPCAINCPRCGSTIMPLLGYTEMTLREALQEKRRDQGINRGNHNSKIGTHSSATTKTATNLDADFLKEQHEYAYSTSEQYHDDDSLSLPAQLSPHVDLGLNEDSIDSNVDHHRQRSTEGEFVGEKEGFVAYLSPSSMRLSLEKLVDEHGERILERETLRTLHPRLFYNLWWFSARFSLPLPLAITSALDASLSGTEQTNNASRTASGSKELYHFCAFAGWDYRVALQGCKSGAQAFQLLLHSSSKSQKHLEHQSSQGVLDSEEFLSDDFPLLSHFNLQSFAQGDWDHPDLSKILVTLVEACDKRDFRSVVECVIQCNEARREKFSSKQSDCSGSDVVSGSSGVNESGTSGTNLAHVVELDCYRTILYLARYQCTTAFHTFFPATSKACKGYHFWCATGTPLPIFDRMFRDAVARIRNKDGIITPIHDVSDVSLGFRCVFGHII